jgi:hypothetical protein
MASASRKAIREMHRQRKPPVTAPTYEPLAGWHLLRRLFHFRGVRGKLRDDTRALAEHEPGAVGGTVKDC